MAKTIPIHKKGPRKDIENYRPIANLCSASKFFEKLILKRITEIADDNNVDITNTRQHGYKKLCYWLSWYMHIPIYMYLLGEKKNRGRSEVEHSMCTYLCMYKDF